MMKNETNQSKLVAENKQSVEDVVAKWVKQDVSKFMRTLPLLIEH